MGAEGGEVNKFLLARGMKLMNFSSEDLRVFMHPLLVDVPAVSRETETRGSGNLVWCRPQVAGKWEI